MQPNSNSTTARNSPKRFRCIGAVVVFGIATCCLLLSRSRGEEGKPPITFRYVTTGEFNDHGYLSFGGTTFWATNHTSNNVVVTLRAIEVKAGSNWITQLRTPEVLRFRPTGKPVPLLWMEPHDSGYATLKISGQPTGGTWRVRISAAEQLTGLAETSARISRYPQTLRQRVQTGNTNISLNPFATNRFYYGKGIEITSQEISDE